MKKLTIMLFISTLLPLCAQNLLENSSFETINEQKNIPASWSVIKRGLFENTHSFNNTISLDGKNSASIINNSGMTQGVTLLYMQGLGQKINQLKPGTALEFSVYARAISGSARARMYFESLKSKKTFLRDVNVSDEKWSKISLRFTKEDIDYGAPYVCLGLVRGSGIVFDCAYLGTASDNPYSKLLAAEDLVSNGSFEKTKNNMPLNWNILNRTQNGKADFITDGGASGKNSVKLSAADKLKGLLMWNQSLDITAFENIAPDTEIEITLKAKTDKASTVFRFYVEFMQGRKFIGTFIAHNQKCTNNFEEKKLTFKMPKTIPTAANLYLQLMSPGEVTFDDVSMKIKK